MTVLVDSTSQRMGELVREHFLDFSARTSAPADSIRADLIARIGDGLEGSEADERWHLHELDPACGPTPGALTRPRSLERLAATLADVDGLVARLARELVERCCQLTVEIRALEQEIAARLCTLAPSLLAICGCAALTAAEIVGETAGVERFASSDAYARYNGSAPLPVSSAGRVQHRLSRSGNRQLNAALYRIALAQSQWHPQAKALLARRRAQGDSPRAARRVLKRRPSDVVYRALWADAHARLPMAA